ncbi:hypothetical protein BJX61DRAFT_539169 [Aspergillus egyptiacus]|nr:hypothetical protein BJX61DRAFT_539169 [Aspergillus egyptiacus]
MGEQAAQVNIKKYDKSGLKRGQFVMVSEDLAEKSLAEVRAILGQAKNFASEFGLASFCTKDGDEVAEDFKFMDYAQLVGDPVKKPDADGPGRYTVCFRVKKIGTELDDDTRGSVAEALSLDFKEDKTPLLQALTTKLASSYDHSQFAAQASSKAAVHPSDMTVNQWNVVVRMNSLLNGQNVRMTPVAKGAETKSLVDIERGVYTAFEFKERSFEPHEISSSAVGSTQKLRIPRFRVVDDSSVDVFETKSSMATALAQSSFSETAVQAAIRGCIWRQSRREGRVQRVRAEAMGQLNPGGPRNHESFENFPRVVVRLDPDTLVLSPECKEEIEKVKDIETLNSFYDKFGRFFAKKVTLGGRLHAEKELSSFSTASKEQKAEMMKAAASFSFSSAFVEASASASHEKGSQASKDTSESKLDSSLTWQAQGGDTLLCNNPPAWCPTVASYYNWRIIKQDEICPLLDVISAIPGHAKVRRQFAEAGYIDGEIHFRLQIHASSMKGQFIALGDVPSNKRPNFEVPYYASTPRQRRQGYRLNYRLKYEPLAFTTGTESEQVYFSAYTKDFEKIENDHLQYFVPYRLYHPATGRWLAATWPAENVTSQIFLYGGDIDDATIFRLGDPWDGSIEGNLPDNGSVQLRVYDNEDNMLGLAGRMNSFGHPSIVGAFPYQDALEVDIAYSNLHYKPRN